MKERAAKQRAQERKEKQDEKERLAADKATAAKEKTRKAGRVRGEELHRGPAPSGVVAVIVARHARLLDGGQRSTARVQGEADREDEFLTPRANMSLLPLALLEQASFFNRADICQLTLT